MEKEITILISIDGLRCDFDTLYGHESCPTLLSFAKSGVRARKVVAEFNTITLPNHMTMVTGLHSENHGIVANRMFDPTMDDVFTSFSNIGKGHPRAKCHLDLDKAIWWWNAGQAKSDPIWTINQKRGGVSAVFAWPLGQIPYSGVTPSHLSDFNCDDASTIAYKDRIDCVMSWFQPQQQVPNFVALYFGDLDDAAHAYGCQSSQVVETLKS